MPPTRDEVSSENLIAQVLLLQHQLLDTDPKLGLKTVLEHVAGAATDMFHGDSAFIFPYDAVSKTFQLDQVTGAPVKPVTAPVLTPPLPGGILRIILQSPDRVWLVSDVSSGDADNPIREQLASLQADHDIRAFIGMRLEMAGADVGVLTVNFSQPRKASSADLQLAQVFSHLAAIAIHNALDWESDRREHQLAQTLHEASREIVKASDLRTVITRILRGALEMMGTTSGVIHLFNVGKHGIERSFEIPQGFHSVPRLSNPQGMTTQMISLRKPLSVEDVPDDPRVAPEVKAKNVKSLVGVPLLSSQDILGVLYINFFEPHRFTSAETESLIALSEHAVVAINHARLVDGYAKRNEALGRLIDVSASLSASVTNSKQTLDLIVRSAVDLIGTKRGAIALYQDGHARVEAGYDIDGNPVDIGREFKTDTELQRRLREHKQHVEVSNVATAPLLTAEDRGIFEENGITSVLLVPLVFEGKAIGSIGVDEVGPHRDFTGDEIHLLQALADQAAIAVHNSRLFSQRMALSEIAHEISGLRETDELLQEILKRSTILLRCPVGAIARYNRKTDELRFTYAVGEAPDIVIPKGKGLTWAAFTSGQTVVVDDVRKDSRYFQDVSSTRSELDVPLRVGNRTIGVLNFESPEVAFFKDDDVKVAESLAAQAATALANADLFERMEDLYQTGQALTSGAKRKQETEIFEVIRQQADKLMDTQNMYISLHDEDTQTIRFPLYYERGERKEWPPRVADWSARGRTEHILRTKAPLLQHTLAEAATFYDQPGYRLPKYSNDIAGSWIGVPMRLENKVIGVIATYNFEREHVYDENDETILQALANFAAIAVDNARLYYGYNEKLQGLVEVGQTLAKSITRSEDDIFKVIYDETHLLTGADDMYIATYDGATDLITFRFAMENGQTQKVGEEPWESRRADKELRGRTEEIIFSGKPLFHQNYATADAWYKLPGHKEFQGKIQKSWLGVPMLRDGKVFGVIAVYDYDHEYAFDESDRMAIETMTSQAAIALDNARLLAETQQQQNQIIALKQLTALGTATAALQHRIYNSFNIIVPNITRLRSRVNVDDPDIAEILEIIERNALYTSNIIKRIQEPLVDRTPAQMDINAVLDGVVRDQVETWNRDSSRPKVALTADLADDLPLITAPPGQVTEVFKNLIENAYKAMKSGGTVRVTSRCDDNCIWVRVADTGPGIPPTIRNRLFKAPVPPKEAGQGAGLGLWLSQLMVQSIGGEIEIEPPGETGTLIAVRIPVQNREVVV